MRIILGYFWISLIALVPFAAFGQFEEPPQGQTQQEPPPRQPRVKLPKEPKSYKPTGVRFGTNMVRLTRSAFDGGYRSFDFTGDIDFYRYMLEVGYGVENFDEQKPLHDYTSKGNFFRVGADANLISNPEKGNALLLGLKYVFANYDETLTYSTSSLVYGDRQLNLSNDNVRARWAEFNFGMKGKVFSNLHTGFYVRFKIFKQTRNDGELLETYKIPGFGLGAEDNRVGFDYYIMWRIPFKQDQVILNEI